MSKLKRFLLWIALIFFGFYEMDCLIALFGESGSDFLLSVVITAVILFFIIRALRKPKAEKISAGKARSTSSSLSFPEKSTRWNDLPMVSYQPMSLEDAIQVEDYVVVDVETTGLHPETDEIIEVAAIRSIGGKFEVYRTLVFPRNRIPEFVTQLTGIRNIDVMNAPQIKKVAPQLLDFIRGLPVVAHNAPFDVKFIAAAFRNIGANIDIRYIDTVPMARMAFPGMQNYKLGTLIESLNLIQGKQQHRAESDATATLRLFELCQSEIPRRAAEEKRLYEQEQLLEKAYHLNQFGMQAEAAGNVAKAIGYYEDVLEEKVPLPNAYMRLAVIYKKQHRWEDVVRVCDAALAVLPGNQGKLCDPLEWEKRKAYALAKMDNDDVFDSEQPLICPEPEKKTAITTVPIIEEQPEPQPQVIVREVYIKEQEPELEPESPTKKSWLDDLPEYERRRKRIEENKKNGVACCPRCGSTSLSANKKGYSFVKGVLLSPLGGTIGMNKIKITCLNCGHKFKPGR